MKKLKPPMNADERRCKKQFIRVYLRSSAVHFLSVVLGGAAIAPACPLCRDSVSSTQAAGFNGSIEWMLGGLAAVMAVVGVKIWREFV